MSAKVWNHGSGLNGHKRFQHRFEQFFPGDLNLASRHRLGVGTTGKLKTFLVWFLENEAWKRNPWNIAPFQYSHRLLIFLVRRILYEINLLRKNRVDWILVVCYVNMKHKASKSSMHDNFLLVERGCKNCNGINMSSLGTLNLWLSQILDGLHHFIATYPVYSSLDFMVSTCIGSHNRVYHNHLNKSFNLDLGVTRTSSLSNSICMALPLDSSHPVRVGKDFWDWEPCAVAQFCLILLMPYLFAYGGTGKAIYPWKYGNYDLAPGCREILVRWWC
jgi:hypothetical protein